MRVVFYNFLLSVWISLWNTVSRVWLLQSQHLKGSLLLCLVICVYRGTRFRKEPNLHSYQMPQVNTYMWIPLSKGGGGGTKTQFNTGRLRPEVEPLTFFYVPFWQKRHPFYISFIEKRYPFHLPTLEHCTPFLSPCNGVNEQYYGRISSITRTNVKQTASAIYSVHGPFKYLNDQFPNPFIYLNLWNIPKAWKRYPLLGGASPYRPL